MALKKKQGREFQSEWTEAFAFVRNANGFPTCLICKEQLAHNKKSNLQRHFITKHETFSAQYPAGDIRNRAIEELLKAHQKNSFNYWMQPNHDDHSSSVVSSAIPVDDDRYGLMKSIDNRRLNGSNPECDIVGWGNSLVQGLPVSVTLDEPADVINYYCTEEEEGTELPRKKPKRPDQEELMARKLKLSIDIMEREKYLKSLQIYKLERELMLSPSVFTAHINKETFLKENKVNNIPNASTSSADTTPKRRTDFESSLLQFINSPVSVEPHDEDKLFFDSFIPTIKSFNEDQKLDLKSEVLYLVKRIKRENSDLESKCNK